MLRLTRQHILRHYKGRMDELTVTVSGSRRGWSIFMKPPAKNDGPKPIEQYSKYSHLVVLVRSHMALYSTLFLHSSEWSTAKALGVDLPSMRSLIARSLVVFRDKIPKFKRWECNVQEWESAVLSTPFMLSEYGAKVLGCWQQYESVISAESDGYVRLVFPSQAGAPCDTLGASVSPPPHKEEHMPEMRAKFSVTGVQEHFSDEAKTNKVGETLTMAPVCKSGPYPADGTDEDNTFARWSPSGSLTLYVANPNLWGKYEVGSKHYLDFSPAGV